MTYLTVPHPPPTRGIVLKASLKPPAWIKSLPGLALRNEDMVSYNCARVAAPNQMHDCLIGEEAKEAEEETEKGCHVRPTSTAQNHDVMGLRLGVPR